MQPEERKRVMREMAAEMKIPLYHRFSETDARRILEISNTELREIQDEGRIACLRTTPQKRVFFGFQLIDFLVDNLTTTTNGNGPASRPEASQTTPSKQAEPERLLVSIEEAMRSLGIGRTKLYELINEKKIEVVKIGRRTLVRSVSLRRLAGEEPKSE